MIHQIVSAGKCWTLLWACLNRSSLQTFSNFFSILSFSSYQNNPVPKASEFKVDSFQFDDFSLEPDQMLKASLRMFIDCGFIHEFHIDYEVIKISPSYTNLLICFCNQRIVFDC